MRIGIKYCGGCNPSFDRIKFVKLLEEEFIKDYFEIAAENVNYDEIIVICGCSRACAGFKHLICKQFIIVTKEKDYSLLQSNLNK